MKTLYRETPVWLAAGLRVTCLGLITLLLLPATSRGQSGAGPGVPQLPPPGASEVGRLNPGEDPGKPCARQAPSRDLRPAADNLRVPAATGCSRPASGVTRTCPLTSGIGLALSQ
jgi:hypothetical protein